MVVVLGVALMALNVIIMPAAIVSDIHARSDEKIRSTKDGNILYVGGTGPDNYTTIQDAIDDADNGDTIMVYPGHYNESLVIKKIGAVIWKGMEKHCYQWRCKTCYPDRE